MSHDAKQNGQQPIIWGIFFRPTILRWATTFQINLRFLWFCAETRGFARHGTQFDTYGQFPAKYIHVNNAVDCGMKMNR